MTFDFTQDEYLAELRRVIEARGPKYRGAVPEEGGTCSYLPDELAPEVVAGSKYMMGDPIYYGSTPRSSPDRCVHGQALHNLGVSDETLAAHEKNTITWLLKQESGFETGFRSVMQVIQARQDEGDEYGRLLPLLDFMKS